MKSNNRRDALAELKRSQARARRNRNLGFVGVVSAIVLVLAVLVFIGLNHDKKSGPTTAADAQVTSLVGKVPPATFDTVGVGDGNKMPVPLSASPLTADGKPRVLYVGAEYCPYCAAERWAVVAALSRFGTFSNLGQTESSATDVYPNTSTLSFHGSSYTSQYLSFTGVETQDNNGKPLDSLAAADDKLFTTYDAPPYVAGSKGSIPFIDIGGSYVSSGASYSPQVLAGMSHLQIAQALADPDSDVAKAVDGTANGFTAALCKLTGGKPGDVCTSKGVTTATAQLAASSS